MNPTARQAYSTAVYLDSVLLPRLRDAQARYRGRGADLTSGKGTSFTSVDVVGCLLGQGYDVAADDIEAVGLKTALLLECCGWLEEGIEVGCFSEEPLNLLEPEFGGTLSFVRDLARPYPGEATPPWISMQSEYDAMFAGRGDPGPRFQRDMSYAFESLTPEHLGFLDLVYFAEPAHWSGAVEIIEDYASYVERAPLRMTSGEFGETTAWALSGPAALDDCSETFDGSPARWRATPCHQVAGIASSSAVLPGLAGDRLDGRLSELQDLRARISASFGRLVIDAGTEVMIDPREGESPGVTAPRPTEQWPVRESQPKSLGQGE